MSRQKVAVGPGASSLILIAVVLALSVLTVLTMVSARNDEALALRSIETRKEVYGLYAAGEQSLAELDGVLCALLKDGQQDQESYLAAVGEKLPERMKLRGDQVFWTEQAGTRSLECAVRILEPGAEQRTAWTLHRLSAGDIWEEDDFDDFGDDDFGDEDSEDEDSEEDFEDEDAGEEDSPDGDPEDEDLTDGDSSGENPDADSTGEQDNMDAGEENDA